jgi:hypothetical protein
MQNVALVTTAKCSIVLKVNNHNALLCTLWRKEIDNSSAEHSLTSQNLTQVSEVWYDMKVSDIKHLNDITNLSVPVISIILKYNNILKNYFWSFYSKVDYEGQ